MISGELCSDRIFQFDIPGDPLLKTLCETAKSHAERTAVIDGGDTYSYRDLFGRARSFAAYLRVAGVVPGSLVALSMRKEYSYIYAVLGCLFNGNTFLPIDAGYPSDRKHYMISDAAAAAAIVNFEMCEPITNVPIVIDARRINHIDAADFHIGQPLSSAYTIYTSGTTGRPKGVPITSTALYAFIKTQGRDLDVSSVSRFISTASISFDMSIWEIFMALCHGAAIVTVDRDTIIDGRKLGAALKSHAVTHVLMTPSMLSILPSDMFYPSLQCVVSAGEKCSAQLVKLWSNRTNFYDAYGATEATIYTTIIRKTVSTPPSCVGTPMNGTAIAIIDEKGAVLDRGHLGEICIVGDSVSSGYHNRPALNAEKFIRIDGRPAYRTGDAGFMEADGRLFYKGRIDRQVKFNGYRIELEEIERVANESGMVSSAAALLHTTSVGKTALLLFIVPHELGASISSDLRQAIRKILPPYMMPSRIFEIALMPMTSSGKINELQLLTRIPEKIS